MILETAEVQMRKIPDTSTGNTVLNGKITHFLIKVIAAMGTIIIAGMTWFFTEIYGRLERIETQQAEIIRSVEQRLTRVEIILQERFKNEPAQH